MKANKTYPLQDVKKKSRINITLLIYYFYSSILIELKVSTCIVVRDILYHTSKRLFIIRK